LDFNKYQYDGVRWCINHELNILNLGTSLIRGGIIADEMGLGKTIMMLGTIYSNCMKRTLIILPPILINQWKNEIFKTTGHQALIYYGPKKKTITKDQLFNSTIVLTSYNLIAMNSKSIPTILHKIKWNRVICDEAHHLRNQNTTRFLGFRNIQSSIKWFITGTPIQNNKKDFYTLCELLGIDKKIYKNIEHYSIIVENCILRRTKLNVGIKMSNLNVNTCIVPWSCLYEKFLSEEIHSLIKVSNVSEIKKGQFSNNIENSQLVAFLKAKQSCIMNSLMKPIMDKLIINQKIDKRYNECLNISSKLNAVIKMIIERKNNKKGKIIFCQFRKEIDFIEEQLLKEGLTVLTLDGRCTGLKRLNKLQLKVDVLILQIQTCCEGLNLQANYSEIYFVSPHWNPSVEDQSIARCHRLGQTKEVNVYKFEMSSFDSNDNTTNIEHYIKEVQTKKRIISFEILG